MMEQLKNIPQETNENKLGDEKLWNLKKLQSG